MVSADRPRHEYRSHRSCDALGCSQIHAPRTSLEEPQDPCIQSATELLLYGVGGLVLCLLATFAVVRFGLYQKMLFVKWLSIIMWCGMAVNCFEFVYLTRCICGPIVMANKRKTVGLYKLSSSSISFLIAPATHSDRSRMNGHA
jgi:hypothetical protein